MISIRETKSLLRMLLQIKTELQTV